MKRPTTPSEWMSPEEFANTYNVSRTTAYETFQRLDHIHIGRCIRVRRSEVEAKVRRHERI